ncbi:CAP-Gly domain-containing linker protein 2 [Phytophthora cinnamomi]|uniref:CAP-Gly domain-containing linker protein 2 n=1 Tax=Phytophthora cinnamomi TaxID=4785 RepID=UPI00355A8F64|nr:CAP-Gly domain-containing linker protein 2 [Phytophthora cinnamomi]
MNNMKATVARLEKQYAELSLRSARSTRNMKASVNVGEDRALVTRSRIASDYADAVELTRRLGADNLYLKTEIQQQAAWKINLSRVLQSCMEMDGPCWAQQFQQPALGGEEVLHMRLDQRDQLDAAMEFGFHPISDLRLTQLILENSRTVSRVQSRLLVPSSLDTAGGARTRRIHSFGWDMIQRVHGNIMECVFTKKFSGLNVAQLMQKTWANDMKLGGFKKVKGETNRLEVLQQVNPNAYVLVRDAKSPTVDISIFRSVFVRFLIETSKRISVSAGTSVPTGIDATAPSTPPAWDSESEEIMLEATGYVLGTQSFDTDFSRSPREEDVRNKVAWAHLSLSIEFLNVVNPVTGEEYQQLRWSGLTDHCGPEHARRNMSDMMQGVLRWELLVIAPAVRLVS